MRWQRIEYILKGIYLGIVLFLALALREEASWTRLWLIEFITFGALGIAIAFLAAVDIHRGHQVHGRLGAFLLFLILDNPPVVYTSVFCGLTAAALTLLLGLDDEAAF